MKKTDNNETKYIFILIGILAFHLVNNFLWLKVDKTLLADDPFGHLLSSFQVYRFLENGDFLLHPLKCLLYIGEHSHQYGIFVYLISAPFYFILGIGQDQVAMVNACIFLTLLIFSIYGITKRLANSQAGILSAFIISMYPVIFNHARMYMLDLPLTALVSLSIYFLVCYGLSKKNKYIFLFLPVLFLGLLTKINFILFVFTPLLIILTKRPVLFRRRAIVFLLLGVIFAYFSIKGEKIFEWLAQVLVLFKFVRLTESLPNIFHYFLRLMDNGFSFFLAIIFGISIFYQIKNKEKISFAIFFNLAFINSVYTCFFYCPIPYGKVFYASFGL